MKLSGRRRIGIAMAVLWLPIGFQFGNHYGAHQSDWATAMMEHCSNVKSAAWATCLTLFNHEYHEHDLRMRLWSGGIVAVMPVLVAWLVAFTYVPRFQGVRQVPINHSDAQLKALSLVAFVLMIVSMLGLLMVDALFSSSTIPIAVQCAAVALMLWARVTFGRRSFHATADPGSGGLVTTGPYRYIRHPIYTAVCIFGWAGIAAHVSIAALAIGGLLVIGAITRMLCEERLVATAYPEYREYARRTSRMIPYLF